MHLGDQLSAYADSEVDPAARVSIEAHLAGCELCRDELAAISEVRDRLRALPMVEPPIGAFQIPAQVVQLHTGRRRMLVAAAATVTLVVGIGLGVNGNQTVHLPLNEVVEQHVARASVDPGFNVIQVQAVVSR